jgi:cytochrome c peroxidase
MKNRVALVLAFVAANACRDEAASDQEGVECQTPAAEDLVPHFDASSAGGLMGGNGGPTRGGDGPGDVDAGMEAPSLIEGCPPGGTPALLGRVHIVANPYGIAADALMPDPQCDFKALDDFATSRFLGTNRRQCMTCHADDAEWGSTPEAFRDRFENGTRYLVNGPRLVGNAQAVENDDLEPAFRVIDATNSPFADVSTPAARAQAYSLLLTRGLFRMGLAMPADAEFELVEVEDPYGFASATELSLFRRSPPMTNLRFNTTIMADGRETLACETLTTSLQHQVTTAVKGHAQGATPRQDIVASIVRGELLLYTAQLLHTTAGELDEEGGRGGPVALAEEPFYWGINAFGKSDPQGKPYSSQVFSLYGPWLELAGDSERARMRRLIARGERIFNEREFTVRGVSGFHEEPVARGIQATCGACHNSPNVGTNSEGRLMDIGTSEEANSSELPIYTLRARSDGATVRTSDPGRALITGRWSDMDRFKVPNLRSLAGRAPYFHNGSASSLEAVVAFHDRRFAIGLTAEETAALVAFLSAL